jgi:hypothetical protein
MEPVVLRYRRAVRFALAAREYDLVLLIQPREREVRDPDSLPVVGDLLAGAIDNMSDLVRDHEFQVLSQTVIDAPLPEQRTHRQ